MKGKATNESLDLDPAGRAGLYSASRETEISRIAVSPALAASGHVRNSRRVGRRWNRSIRGDRAVVGGRYLLSSAVKRRGTDSAVPVARVQLRIM